MSELRLCRTDPAFAIRALCLDRDIALLHRWFGLEHGRFWGWQDLTESQVAQAYRDMQAHGRARAYMGLYKGRQAFLFECYDPCSDEIGEHYPVRSGDLGMHLFVGPPHGDRIPAFTRRVFRTVLSFLFDQPAVLRIVVEPDLRNEKVRRLNHAMGFVRQREIQMRAKRADLAFCTRADFFATLAQPPGNKPPP